MLVRIRVLAFSSLAALLSIPFLACQGTGEHEEHVAAPGAPAPEPEFTPIVSGMAGFVDIGKGETQVKLLLRGTHSHPGNVPAELESVGVYGGPGRHGKDELGASNTFVAQLSGTDLTGRSWTFQPKKQPKDKLTFKLADLGVERLEDYSVLLRFTYKTNTGQQIFDRAGMFSSWALPATQLDLKVPDGNPGDTITLLNGTGTFWGAQGIAMYDFTVNFTGTATKVEAFAARANAPGWPASYHKVYSETFTHLTGPHSVTGATGRYSDAYDEYWFQVQVTELVGGVATLVPPKQGTFTDVIASGGALVDLVE